MMWILTMPRVIRPRTQGSWFECQGPFEIYADEFSQILGSSPELTLLSSDLVFAEGVCWLPSRNYVIVSDFPNNRIMKWDETSGMDIFRQPSDCANGNTVDAEGRVLSCLTRGRDRRPS